MIVYEIPDGWETSYGLDPLHNGTEKYILKANFDYYTVSDLSGDDGPGGDPATETGSPIPRSIATGPLPRAPTLMATGS